MNLKLELRIPLSNKFKLNTGLCLGPKLVYESIKTSINNIYTQNAYPYKKGDITNNINVDNFFYVLPYSEGYVGLNLLLSPGIYLSLNAKIGYIFPSNFVKEETKYSQIDFWPEEDKLTTFKSGDLYRGINLAMGIEVNINI